MGEGKSFDVSAMRGKAAGWLGDPYGRGKPKAKKPPKLSLGLAPDATDAVLRERSRAEIDRQMQAGKGRYGAGLFGSVVRPLPKKPGPRGGGLPQR